MNQIPLLGDNTNFYHKRTDSAIQVKPRFFPDGKPMMTPDGKLPANLQSWQIKYHRTLQRRDESWRSVAF